jgi:hypothetical protein
VFFANQIGSLRQKMPFLLYNYSFPKKEEGAFCITITQIIQDQPQIGDTAQKLPSGRRVNQERYL